VKTGHDGHLGCVGRSIPLDFLSLNPGGFRQMTAKRALVSDLWSDAREAIACRFLFPARTSRVAPAAAT
jgi:hypothetical protein